MRLIIYFTSWQQFTNIHWIIFTPIKEFHFVSTFFLLSQSGIPCSPKTLSPVISALCHLVVFFKINEWSYQQAVYAEQSHLGLTLPQTLHSAAPNTLLLLSSSSWLAHFLEWGISVPQHITSIATACLLRQLCRLFPNYRFADNNLHLVGCNGSDEAMHVTGCVIMQLWVAVGLGLWLFTGGIFPLRECKWNFCWKIRIATEQKHVWYQCTVLTNAVDNASVSRCIHSSSIWIEKDWHPRTRTHTRPCTHAIN